MPEQTNPLAELAAIREMLDPDGIDANRSVLELVGADLARLNGEAMAERAAKLKAQNSLNLVVAAGNPFDGMRLFGGFADQDDMESWTDQHLSGEHWWYPQVLNAHVDAAQDAVDFLRPQG